MGSQQGCSDVMMESLQGHGDVRTSQWGHDYRLCSFNANFGIYYQTPRMPFSITRDVPETQEMNVKTF